MKYILRLAMTLTMVLGIAVTSFAVISSNTKFKFVKKAEKQTIMRNHNRHHRQGVKKVRGKRQTSSRRAYRLTERQRRYANQKLLDILLD